MISPNMRSPVQIIGLQGTQSAVRHRQCRSTLGMMAVSVRDSATVGRHRLRVGNFKIEEDNEDEYKESQRRAVSYKEMPRTWMECIRHGETLIYITKFKNVDLGTECKRCIELADSTK